MNEKYPTYQVGDKLKCLKTVHFMDGTKHQAGVTYIIKEGETAYYEVNWRDYQKID